MPEFNNKNDMENFLKAVIYIHQCDNYTELAGAENTIYQASHKFDAVDFSQLKKMITSHRNRIDRNNNHYATNK